MSRSGDWFRPFYAFVRASFVLFEGGWHKPHALLKALRKDDKTGLRGFRQKELERLLLIAAKRRAPCIKARFHAKGFEFSLVSVPDLVDMRPPKGVPRAVRKDARYQALVDAFEAARETVERGGNPEAALRAFNGFFPHETRALRALSDALRKLLVRILDQLRADPHDADEWVRRSATVPLGPARPDETPGVRAYAIVRCAVVHRRELESASARFNLG